MERKVRKAVEVINFQEDWEVIPRNYGYEIKVFNASAGEVDSIAKALGEVIGYGDYVVVLRKTVNYDCIRCEY